METFKTKLGTTRAGERTRIWIEGTRLTLAGFAPGMQYVARWTDATLTLTNAAVVTGDGLEVRKVSGKGSKPIIDITGQQVFNTFGKRATHVRVSYGAGTIVIRADI